ncbi:DUF3413 domain-containing protein [Polaribacter gochangensis]|uniref:DUF3413 domain-containing protein n=1 Tax=Polaribacter gochangensis TaxID=3252903 RepID=UPI00390488FD
MNTKKIFRKELFIGFLLNLVIVFYIARTYVKYIESSEYLLANLYSIFSTISHFILLFLPTLFISYLIYFITKSKKVSRIVFATLSLCSLLLLGLDSMIFSQFRYHLSPFVFKLVFGKNATDVFQFSGTTIFLVFLKIMGLLVLQILILYIAKKIVTKNVRLRTKLLSWVFIVSLLFTHVVYAWADASYYRPITQISHVYPLFHPLTAKRFLTENGFVDPEKARKNRDLYKISYTNTVKYPLEEIISEKPDTQKNILFLTIDSWRFDCMDSIVTPNIYKLSKKSQHFTNHYSGSNGTDGGIFSMFYGFSGLYWEQFTQIEKSPVFIDKMLQQNYSFHILASATLQNPPFDKNVFSAIPSLRLSSKAKTVIGKDIEITNELLGSISSSNTKPFFSFLFYDAAHAYEYPEDYKLPFKPSLEVVNYLDLDDDYDPTLFFNRYRNSVHFIDNEIGKIIEKLKSENLLESTIIVITGDHGQEFNDNKKGYWQHGGNYSKYQIKVPMILFDASKEPKKYDKLSLHYDIVPTLMSNYLGVKSPMNTYSFGQNLFDLQPREWFVSGYNNNYAIIEKDRITKVFATGLFDITDLDLNPIKEAELNYDVLKNALTEINKFYIKKE